MRIPTSPVRWAVGSLLALSMLAACGGDPAPQVPTSPEATVSAPATPDDDSTASDGTAADGDDDFTRLLTARMDRTWQVEYVPVGSSSGQSFLVANDPPNSAIHAEGQVVFVNTADGAFSCSDQECQPLPEGMDASMMMAGFMGPYAFLFTEDFGDGGPGLNVDSTTDTIAGRSALCKRLSVSALGQGFAGSDLPDDAAIEVCIDEDTGVMLRALTIGDGETEGVEATAFSTSVDAGLFEVN